ncbi:MAG: response regulator, partial [bacterium]|nr:response regulator [bacterium]
MRHDVLVVEDEAGLLRGIVRGLGADPTIHVEGVETVDRAEEVLDSSPPDLLITDIRLPGRSGLDLLLELEKRALRIPVLVMT